MGLAGVSSVNLRCKFCRDRGIYMGSPLSRSLNGIQLVKRGVPETPFQKVGLADVMS